MNSPASRHSNPVLPALILFASFSLLLAGLLAPLPASQWAAASDAAHRDSSATATPVLNPAMVAASLTGPASRVTATPVRNTLTLAAGDSVFHTICVSCHGPNGQGIRGLGKPLVGSPFINSLSDAQLLAFLQTGRPVSDPLNTTGVPMPARGGRPSLTDTDLLNVITYLRSLNSGIR